MLDTVLLVLIFSALGVALVLNIALLVSGLKKKRMIRFFERVSPIRLRPPPHRESLH